MTVELTYLTYTCLFAALMWVPYVTDAILKFGLVESMGFEDRDAAMDNWAKRMKKAHYNMVENLVIFSAFILILNSINVSTPVTKASAITYFWARVSYYFLYTFAIPWLKTLAFFIGWSACLLLAYEILF